MPRHAFPLLALLTLFLAGSSARADTVVLTNGKKLKDVVVSLHDDSVVVVNPFNSRHPEMTWEITAKDRISADKVAEVIVAEPPLQELRLRDAGRGLSAAERLELAAIADGLKLKAVRERQFQLALCADPENSVALKAIGSAKWKTWSRGNPLADSALAELEREYVRLKDPAALDAQLDILRDAGSKRPIVYLERARRSAALPIGVREKVPLTLRSDEAPGATYCIFVPSSYDPLSPTPLVVGLHGGGGDRTPGGVVTGSGESAMGFYADIAERWGWIVVCPTAVVAGWSTQQNHPWMDALLDEMRMLYNVDESRVYLTGHSMGGGGTWYWGAKLGEVWAACSPCAGWGSVTGELGKSVAIYIYHGSDDRIVGPSGDRAAAKQLRDDKSADFVYTELDGVGHGFPRWVRDDIFKFFAARRKDKSKKKVAVWPVSSFDRKVTKEEKKTFGDPSAGPESSGDEDDASVKELLSALKAGGGGGAAAVDELAKLKDAKTVKSVAKLLRSKDASTDTRVLAAQALGKIGIEEAVKALSRHTADDDFRVLEAVATALGDTGLVSAAEPLAKTLASIGATFDEQLTGDKIVWRQYEVRTGSLTVACQACANVVAPDVLVPALRREVAERVFLRKTPLAMLGMDYRFTRIPPASRLALARALARAVAAQGEGTDMLDAAGAEWRSREPQIEAEMKRLGAALPAPVTGE